MKRKARGPITKFNFVKITAPPRRSRGVCGVLAKQHEAFGADTPTMLEKIIEVTVSITGHFNHLHQSPGVMKHMSQKPRAKHWVITLNNPPGDFCLGFDEITDSYLLCGEEVGEQGTPHIQGYVQLKKQTLLSTLKKRWPTAHLEIAKGSPKQNYEYCTKEGHSHDHGEMLKGQGARSDLDEVKRIIDQGGNIGDIRESSYSNYIRYQRSIIADLEHRRPDRSVTTEMVIYWGVTGSGKSHRAISEFPEAYWKTRGDWWDGYDGHETVIIDEFYGWISIDFMLRVADKYPLQVPIKGGFRKFVAKRVIITSNRHWNHWWPNVTNQAVWDAFERRITRCIEFTEPWSESSG